MNSAKRKLFVKRNIKRNSRIYSDIKYTYNRNIKTVSQINEHLLLADITGKTSYDKILKKHKEETLHNELKPLLIMLRLLGCFPVYFSKSCEYIHPYVSTYKVTCMNTYLKYWYLWMVGLKFFKFINSR
jgi:hypothetical protein